MGLTIPASLLTATITIEPYAGTTGAGGPAFGAAVTLKAHVEPRRRLIHMSGGKEARTDMFALCPPGTNAPPESRLTYNGATYRVLGVFDVPAPGGGVHHVEIGFEGRGSAGG